MDKGKEYTKEQIVAIMEKNIAKQIETFGFVGNDGTLVEGFWAKMEREQLEKYLAGGVIIVEKEYEHKDGMDFITDFFSDGTARRCCYGWSD